MLNHYKNLILSFCLIPCGFLPVSATAALTGPGDIAFTGWNADGGDDFSFVALVDINAGESILFTDNEWDGTQFNSGEGEITWTAGVSVPAGNIVSINNTTSVATTNTGSVSGSIDLASSNEGLFALLGSSASPTAFLTAFTSDGPGGGFGTLSSTGLLAGITAIDFNGTTGQDSDIFAYNGPRNGETAFNDYLGSLVDTANWLHQNGPGDESIDGSPPDIPFDSTSFSVIPVPTAFWLFGSALGLLGWMGRRTC